MHRRVIQTEASQMFSQGTQMVRQHFERYLELATNGKFDSALDSLYAALERAHSELRRTSNEADRQTVGNLLTTYARESVSKAGEALDRLSKLRAAPLREKVDPASFWSEAMSIFGQDENVTDDLLRDSAQQLGERLNRYAKEQCDGHNLLPLLARFMRKDALWTYRRFFAVRSSRKHPVH
jgi:hypothetical protein